MYPKPFQKLIEHFSSLPSIGPKMAERLVLYLFKETPEKLKDFSEHLQALKDLTQCSRCFNISEKNLCAICTDKKRDQRRICVVEEALDIIPIERTSAFAGLYHVLGGTLETSASENIAITIPQLLARVKREGTEEVIIATNFTTEGDVTALYLKRKLQFPHLKISRLARGLATGSDIEYADDVTLRAALTNREKIS